MKNLFPLIAVIAFISCSQPETPVEEASIPETETSEVEMAEETPTAGLLTGLSEYVDSFEGAIDTVISKERKELLKEVAAFVDEKNSSEEAANLIFICTHNSRRSHMSQLWAQTAAYHYGFEDVHCYSGGTEATAFNPRAVKALKKAGFNIDQTDMSTNPRYKVSYSKDAEPVMAFSKKYDDDFNPQEDFAAVMTCSQADEACPLVKGASARVAIPYVDPKEADDTPEEEARYDERCRQIAMEMFYLFSQVGKG